MRRYMDCKVAITNGSPSLDTFSALSLEMWTVTKAWQSLKRWQNVANRIYNSSSRHISLWECPLISLWGSQTERVAIDKTGFRADQSHLTCDERSNSGRSIAVPKISDVWMTCNYAEVSERSTAEYYITLHLKNVFFRLMDCGSSWPAAHGASWLSYQHCK